MDEYKSVQLKKVRLDKYCLPLTLLCCRWASGEKLGKRVLNRKWNAQSWRFLLLILWLQIYEKHCTSKALKSMNMSQLVTATTRLVIGTCLNHFYSSHPQFISHVMVLNVGISDHKCLFSSAGSFESHKSQDIFIRYRRTKNMNKNGLMASLSYFPWDICFRWYRWFIKVMLHGTTRNDDF